MSDSKSYTAFISYRHGEPDWHISRQIHRFLESYRIPRTLRRNGTDSGIGHIFRDEEELSASPSLPASIEDALAHSQWLIVVCTPASAKSKWVDREIEAFIEMHGRERVLAVLVDGDPDMSFPPALQAYEAMDSEPLACDLRKVSSPFSRRHELLRLVAPLIGCSFDDLVQRRHRRRVRIAITTTVVALLFLSALLATTWADTQRLRITESRTLAEQSRSLLAEGDRMAAIQTALDALPSGHPGPLDRPFVDEAQGALAEALGVYPTSSLTPFQFRPCYEHHMQGRIEDLAISPNATRIAARDATSTIDIIEADSGALVCSLSSDIDSLATNEGFLPLPSPVIFISSFTGELVLSDSRLLIGYAYYYTLCFDIETGKVIWSAPYSNPSGYAFSHDGEIAAIAAQTGSETDNRPDSLLLFENDSGEQLAEIVLPDRLAGNATPYFSSDDSLVYIPNPDSLLIVDISTRSVRSMPWHLGDEIALTEVGSTLVATSIEPTSESSIIVSGLNASEDSIPWSVTLSSSVEAEDYTNEEPPHPLILPAHEGVCFITIGTTIAVLDTDSGKILATGSLPDPAIDIIAPGASIFEDASSAYVTLHNGERYFVAYVNGGLSAGELESLDAVHVSASVETEEGGSLSYLQALSTDDDGATLEVRRVRAVSDIADFELLATGLPLAYPNSDGSRFIFIGENDAGNGYVNVVYDTQTIEQIGVINLAEFGITIPLARCTSRHPNILAYTQKDASGAFTISTVDIEQGALIAQRTWPASSEAFCSTESSSGLFCIVQGKTIELVDEETLETITVYRDAPITSAAIAGAVASDNTVMIIAGQYADGEPNLFLLNRETGEVITDAEISSYSMSTASDAESFLLVDETHNTFLISCQDGMLRSFDANTGNLLWDIPANVSSGGYLQLSPDNEKVLLQESSGRLRALDADTGEEEGLCEEIPGHLFFIAPTTEQNLIQAYYFDLRDDGRYGYGLITINLADNELHVRDWIPFGVFLSEEASRVVVYSSNVMGTIPYYDYGELRALGERALQEHEEGTS